MMSGREIERNEIRDAIARSSATESIGRKLGDELIAAARETVRQWEVLAINPRNNRFRGLGYAIRHLERLVGRP